MHLQLRKAYPIGIARKAVIGLFWICKAKDQPRIPALILLCYNHKFLAIYPITLVEFHLYIFLHLLVMATLLYYIVEITI